MYQNICTDCRDRQIETMKRMAKIFEIEFDYEKGSVSFPEVQQLPQRELLFSPPIEEDDSENKEGE